MLLPFHSIIEQVISIDYQESVKLQIDFAIDKILNILTFTDCRILDIEEISFLESNNLFEGIEYVKPGSHTLFIARLSMTNSPIQSIVVKPYKITADAIIQYLASLKYLQDQKKTLKIELYNKTFFINPVRALFFCIYSHNKGKTKKLIPIIVEEEIQENLVNTKLDLITRKELFAVGKILASKGYIFDSHPSNWKIMNYNKETNEYFVYYIDLFYINDFMLIKDNIREIKKNLEHK